MKDSYIRMGLLVIFTLGVLIYIYNDICPIHSTLLNEDGSCNKCLNENNK